VIAVVLSPETCAADRLITVSASIAVELSAFSCVVESACVCVDVSAVSCVFVRLFSVVELSPGES
jgi:hypothetical protein